MKFDVGNIFAYFLGRQSVTGILASFDKMAKTRPRNVALLPCIKAFGQVNITGHAETFSCEVDEY